MTVDFEVGDEVLVVSPGNTHDTYDRFFIEFNIRRYNWAQYAVPNKMSRGVIEAVGEHHSGLRLYSVLVKGQQFIMNSKGLEFVRRAPVLDFTKVRSTRSGLAVSNVMKDGDWLCADVRVNGHVLTLHYDLKGWFYPGHECPVDLIGESANV